MYRALLMRLVQPVLRRCGEDGARPHRIDLLNSR